MTPYVVHRALLAIPSLVGVLIVVFVSVRMIPGDAVSQMLDGSYAAGDPAKRAELESKYGLDGNLVEQFAEWSTQLVRADLGESIVSGRPVTSELRTRLPASLELGMMAMAVSILIAIPIGVLSAVKQDSLIDHLTRSFAILILAIPSFWLGLMVIVYGFAWFGWTPPLRYHDPWQDPIANLQHLIAPALILGAGLSGTVLRLTRTTLLEVLRQDYMRTARAKGLGTVSILVTHAMRNSLIPIITVIGVQIPVIVGGTVVLEKIFSVPGMGSFLLAAVQSRDYPVIQAIVIISATVVILSTLAVDLIYPLIDPRIRVR